MLKKTIIYIACSVLFSPLFQIELSARDLIASVGIIPPHSEMGEDGNPRGGFVEVARAIGSVYTGGNIIIKLVPIGRSVNLVLRGEADFQIPYMFHTHVKNEKLPFAYVDEPICLVTFVLYTRADRPKLLLDKLGAYNIETLRGASFHFPFKIAEIDSFEQGILRMVKGRTDGFLVEQDATDAYIRKHKIKNIRRTYYSTTKSCIIIAKGPRRKEMDRIITGSLRKLKATGQLQKITDKIHLPFYDDWQPYLMNW